VPGKPSIGSWLAYGLGSENNDLPAFVVLTPNWKSGAAAQALFTRMWSSGFLASKYTGVVLRHVGDPVLYVQNPPGITDANRRSMLDTLGELNQLALDRYGDPETLTRIAQYEMAFRMQTSVPELTDLSGESQETLELYGPDVSKPGTYAASALWRGGLSNAVCASCRSCIADGTSTATCRAICARSARIPTSRRPRC
jgi:hypothetical protein